VTLEELKAENVAAWERDAHNGDYALVVNTSCSRYIPALEDEVKRLQAELRTIGE
jgi:hypothetical protein